MNNTAAKNRKLLTIKTLCIGVVGVLLSIKIIAQPDEPVTQSPPNGKEQPKIIFIVPWQSKVKHELSMQKNINGYFGGTDIGCHFAFVVRK